MAEAPHALETVDPELALFDGSVQGLVALITPDERPLQGLAGLLDWRFQGAISRCLQHGFLTGKPGECAYVPVARAGQTYHLILVGATTRGTLPTETIQALKRNLQSLKLQRIGISRSDLGGASEDLGKSLKGSGICILR